MNFKLKPEIKEKWVAALRSGEYKQTRGYLSNSNGFCCLGVLCDLHSKETRVPWETIPGRENSGIQMYLNQASDLSIKVAEWAAETIDPMDVHTNFYNPVLYDVTLPSGEHISEAALTSLNDGISQVGPNTTRLTFPEIADLIEKHL